MEMLLRTPSLEDMEQKMEEIKTLLDATKDINIDDQIFQKVSDMIEKDSELHGNTEKKRLIYNEYIKNLKTIINIVEQYQNTPFTKETNKKVKTLLNKILSDIDNLSTIEEEIQEIEITIKQELHQLQDTINPILETTLRDFVEANTMINNSYLYDIVGESRWDPLLNHISIALMNQKSEIQGNTLPSDINYQKLLKNIIYRGEKYSFELPENISFKTENGKKPFNIQEEKERIVGEKKIDKRNILPIQEKEENNTTKERQKKQKAKKTPENKTKSNTLQLKEGMYGYEIQKQGLDSRNLKILEETIEKYLIGKSVNIDGENIRFNQELFERNKEQIIKNFEKFMIFLFKIESSGGKNIGNIAKASTAQGYYQFLTGSFEAAINRGLRHYNGATDSIRYTEDTPNWIKNIHQDFKNGKKRANEYTKENQTSIWIINLFQESRIKEKENHLIGTLLGNAYCARRIYEDIHHTTKKGTTDTNPKTEKKVTREISYINLEELYENKEKA